MYNASNYASCQTNGSGDQSIHSKYQYRVMALTNGTIPQRTDDERRRLTIIGKEDDTHFGEIFAVESVDDSCSKEGDIDF